ncbi:hypothetical protein TNCV_477801, partial [Trichonephila clavipes]
TTFFAKALVKRLEMRKRIKVPPPHVYEEIPTSRRTYPRNYFWPARPLGHEDSPRQDKILICSMQALPRSSTDAQSHLGMPNRRNKVTKNGNGPLRDSLWELLYSPDAPRIAEAVIKTFDGI